MSAPVPRLSDVGPTRLSLLRHGDLPAQRLVRPPLPVRRIALVVALAFPVLALLMLILPWQQSATGSGRVVAWAPANREQTIEAPVDGRLVEWLVREGEPVAEGEALVELRDNDPDRLASLQAQEGAASAALDAAAEQVRGYEARLAAEMSARELVIAEYDAKIASLGQKRTGEVAELEVATINEGRRRTLLSEGIASSRDYELSKLTVDKAQAAVRARDDEIAATRRARDKAAADGDAKIASVRSDLEAARSKLAESRGKRLELQSKVARQATQRVTAPRDGIVLALHGGPGGAQVKKGDLLVTLVPETTDRAVELWVDGNDMPLIRPGARVRLLFEGWPALQLVGLPGGTTGTFAGEVAWIDPAADDKGRFRVVATPSPGEGAWPEPGLLRQGVRAKGFVLLGQVSLGYELWRQINGFPPLLDVDKGEKPNLPTQKKPRAPSELK